MIILFIIWLPILLLIIFSPRIVVTQQQTAKIIKRLGKYNRTTEAGISIRFPWIESVVKILDLKIQQAQISVETKTKDNVFAKFLIAVQYNIIPEKTYEAYYKLAEPEKQIISYVFDTVRAQVPKLTLDEAFERKDDIADAVKKELNETMGSFGYNILKALVTDIEPEEKVKEAMNEINAQQRLQIATTAKAEGNKITIVKAAEAEAESKALQGKGIADQRKNIIKGLEESIKTFTAETGIKPDEVMMTVMLTQYFDTLKEIGITGKTNTIMIPHSPGGLNDIASQIRNAIIQGNETTKK